jgi:2-polyprenyl-6-methoxyphenol hydroxylase-like FAD-dependent oxidoreductase
VTDLIWDDDRVVGVRGQTEGGAIVEERCTLVIGADGQRSFVARAVGAPVYSDRGSLTCAYYTYWSGVPVSGVELYLRERRLIAAFATNDGLSVIFASAPRDEFPALRSDVEGGYLRTLDLVPELAERVRAGRREEPFAGTADLPNFFRRPWGPGWALIGDASYHKDPITGQGITDAFRDAELLADAVDEGVSGRRPLDAALADYELRRNQLAFPIFDLACQIESLAPPMPDEAALYGALRGNQEETSRFFGMIENTVAVQDFFSPESVGRIMAAAGSAA